VVLPKIQEFAFVLVLYSLSVLGASASHCPSPHHTVRPVTIQRPTARTKNALSSKETDHAGVEDEESRRSWRG